MNFLKGCVSIAQTTIYRSKSEASTDLAEQGVG